MEKIKWKYDKKAKMWYVLETKAYKNDGFTIRCPEPGDNTYGLRSDLLFIGTFRKLSSAKTVAELLRNG